MRRLLAACALAGGLLPAMAMAQAQTIYETRGPNGPVYSNQPSPGAKVLVLPPLNVMEAPPAPAMPSAAPAPAARGGTGAAGESAPGAAPAAVPYRDFAIVAPEQDGSVVANAGLFDVRLGVDPALQVGAGHAFAVSIDGRVVAQRFTASEFTIPPEFWGDTLPPPNQRHQLDAAIVDRDGRVLMQAAPVLFVLRHASALQRRAPPVKPPEPPRPPASAPLREPAMKMEQKKLDR